MTDAVDPGAGSPAPTLPAPERGHELDPRLIDILRPQLPKVAELTIDAVMREVPAYAAPFGGPRGRTVAGAVHMAFSGFLRLAKSGRLGQGSSPASAAIEGAYALGETEAAHGRSADALLAAFRVGARVAWREFSGAAVQAGMPAEIVADFAAMVFAYIDELSAASVAGHTDYTESRLRDRERHREQLALALLRGDPEASVLAAAEVAGWEPPATLTAVVVPDAQVRPTLALTDPDSLQLTEGLDGLPQGRSLLLVPDLDRPEREDLVNDLSGRHAVIGPTRPWQLVQASWRRAAAGCLLPTDSTASVDTEARLGELVVSADPEALADLRARVLEPLADLGDAARSKLVETLRLWLLHQGRREEIAQALFVHPQTVRYRMGQLREAYGDRLTDPDWVRDLMIALG